MARLAVMTYEAVLLFAVLFITGYLLLALLRWQYPLGAVQRGVLFGYWVAVLGVYFVWQWRHGGRTLPMKTWDLRISQASGQPLGLLRATARYLLAWHLFLPAVLLIALVPIGPGASLAALAASPYLMLLTALADRDRQLLHDRLLGTRLMREPAPPGRPRPN